MEMKIKRVRISKKMQFQYAIVGFGPAGIFALASLPIHHIGSTLILEQKNIGGDLSTYYGGIKANLTKQEIVNAFRTIPRWQEKPLTSLQTYQDTECPLLCDVSKQIREWILPDIALAQFHTKRMTQLTEVEQGWKVETDSNTFLVKKVILCIGAQPKILNLPKHTIPLSISLCKDLVKNQVSPSDTIAVFGTSHSGTLILQNLKELGCRQVFAFYKGEKPFHYARDGEAGGIKQESAKIADEIVGNHWGEYTPTFVNIDDFSQVYRIVSNANSIIYSLGFEKVQQTYIDRQGNTLHLQHNPDTFQFQDIKYIWGFGFAFPSQSTHTNGKSYPIIGFKGFIDAIQQALPSILE